MKIGTLFIIAASVILSTSLNAQFPKIGGRKPMIKRMLPPYVNLNGKALKIEASASKAQVPADLVRVLQEKTVAEIQKDSRFRIIEPAQTIIRFSITEGFIEQRFAEIKQGMRCPYFYARIETAYQAVDVKTKVPFDSENLKAVVGEYDAGRFGGLGSILGANCASFQKDKKLPGSANEAQAEVTQVIAQQMARRAAPYEDSVEVKLGGNGKIFRNIEDLAGAGRWGKVEEECEKLGAQTKPEDEAWRQYYLGLAAEGMAYEQSREWASLTMKPDEDADKSFSEAKQFHGRANRYMDSAAKYFAKARDTYPREKDFGSADDRVDFAVKLLAKLGEQQEKYEKAMQTMKQQEADKDRKAKEAARAIVPAPPKPAPAAQMSAPPPQPAARTAADAKKGNAELLELLATPIPVSEVLGWIKEQPAGTFDVKSTGALREIYKVKRPQAEITTIWNAMKAKEAPAAPARPVVKK